MTKLSLTVAIPTYNAGDTLIACVDSCRHLGIPDDRLEVLVVDNCSTDGSVDEVERERGSWPALRIVRNEENCGRIGNWNRCLELASSDVLLFLFNNDLVAEDNAVPEALALLETNPRCALVNGPHLIADFELTSIHPVARQAERCLPPGYHRSAAFIRRRIEAGRSAFVPLQANFLRVERVREHGLTFDPTLEISTDGLFLSRLAETTGIVGSASRPSIIWRFSPNRTHASVKFDVQTRNSLRAFAGVARALGSDGPDLAKAYANYPAVEYALTSALRAKRLEDLPESMRVLRIWLEASWREGIVGPRFAFHTLGHLARTAMKGRTLAKLVKARLQI